MRVADAGVSDRRPVELAGLNERQREAVLHRGAPLLILAGAGSGKTRVITTKVAHLVTTGAVSATHILAVTFTNKAADEMRTRVRRLVAECGRGDVGTRVMVRTFHAFGSWLLRVHGERLGFDPARLSIFDDGDVRQILSQVADADADDADEYLAGDIREMAAWIATAKNRGLAPDADLSVMRRSPFPMERLYARYQRRLADLNGVDFGDLILLPAALLRRDAEVRTAVQERFRVVLVDEFQDANQAQFELLRVLHRPPGYLCVVGDDDQSIYRFRGADVDGFLTFPERFAGTEVVRLEQNYRSTGAILDLASSVVSRNRRRMGKTLWTDQDQGELPTVSFLADAEEEARYCADLVRGGRGSTAILYRMNFQSRTFETLFQSLRIPYRLVGTVRFYEREEIKDAVAYLALLYNPRDEVAFRRAAAKPRRGIGPKTAGRVAEQAKATGGDLIAAAAALAAARRGSARAALAGFAALLTDLQQVHETGTVTDLVRAVLERSGLYASVAAQDQAERTGRALNLDELVGATAPYGSGPAGLAEFLETARLAGVVEERDDQEEEGAPGAAGPPVTLITAHNTKGLEFDQVIVTGLEEGIFPAAEPAAPRLAMPPEEEEEERRLFYVAATRARFALHLTACRRRMAFGFAREREPSRFVTEIPPELVRVAGGAGDGDPEPGALREGQGVSHLDYGIGVVERRWLNEGEAMLRVRFQSGRTATFFAAYADLDPIAGDD